MTSAEWITLAERCEKATGPDRDIDRCIAAAIPDGFQVLPYVGFTDSLDAITALIERELPGCGYCVSFPGNQGPSYATASIEQSEELWTYEGWGNSRAATPAFALCSAFCRAMAAKESP